VYDPDPPARESAGEQAGVESWAHGTGLVHTGETVGQRTDHPQHSRRDPRLGSGPLNGEHSALNRCHSQTLDTNKEEPGLHA